MPRIPSNPAAFDLFYDTLVVVTAPRRQDNRMIEHRATLRASVIDCGYADDILDETEGVASKVRKASVNVRRYGPRGWPWTFEPQLGDRIKLMDGGKTYAVTNVETIDRDIEWILEARET